jgi:hypothetical protein
MRAQWKNKAVRLQTRTYSGSMALERAFTRSSWLCMVLTKVMRNPSPTSLFASWKAGAVCPWAGRGMSTACKAALRLRTSSFACLSSRVSMSSAEVAHHFTNYRTILQRFRKLDQHSIRVSLVKISCRARTVT